MAEREAVRVLVFSASLRAESLNTRLANLARGVIENHGGTVDLATMKEFDCPSYDQDAQSATGFPPGAEQFRSRIEDVDAFVIASPEYNGSFPGVLKNDRLGLAVSAPAIQRETGDADLHVAVDGRWQPRPLGPAGAARASRRPHVSGHVLTRPGPPGVRPRRQDRQPDTRRSVR